MDTKYPISESTLSEESIAFAIHCIIFTCAENEYCCETLHIGIDTFLRFCYRINPCKRLLIKSSVLCANLAAKYNETCYDGMEWELIEDILTKLYHRANLKGVDLIKEDEIVDLEMRILKKLDYHIMISTSLQITMERMWACDQKKMERIHHYLCCTFTKPSLHFIGTRHGISKTILRWRKGEKETLLRKNVIMVINKFTSRFQYLEKGEGIL
ncbi:MAG: hypothetical protein ACTSUE_20380 [Promethearchaeota archaeon]